MMADEKLAPTQKMKNLGMFVQNTFLHTKDAKIQKVLHGRYNLDKPKTRGTAPLRPSSLWIQGINTTAAKEATHGESTLEVISKAECDVWISY